MPAAVAVLDEPLDLGKDRIRWTRTRYHQLIDMDIVTERTELLDGDIIPKMPQNPPHRITLYFVSAWLETVFGRAFVQQQQSVELSDEDSEINEPEPDISVLAKPIPSYQSGNPPPDEIVLAVEISDTTIHKDVGKKARLYSRAGFPEYWIADVNMRQIIVHREPTDNGYTSIVSYSGEEEIVLLAKPEAKIAVSALFPADDAQD